MTRPNLPIEEFPDDFVEEDEDEAYARFRRPPPGKPALLPEEPPRKLDDTPVASGVLGGPDMEGSLLRRALSSDEAALLEVSRREVFGASFALPLLIIFGLFGLMLALSGDDPAPASGSQPAYTPSMLPTQEPTPVAGAAWPADLFYVPHTVPALIKDDILYLGAQMGYRFFGQAGTVWAITVEARESALDPQVTLFGPGGAVIATNDNRAAGVTAADLVVTLPETGDYRVVVESSAANPTTGSYLLAVFER